MAGARGIDFWWIQRPVAAVFDLVFPPVCSFCFSDIEDRSPIDDLSDGGHNLNADGRLELSLCEPCRSALVPEYSQKCRSCGAGLDLSSDEKKWRDSCRHCQRSQFKFNRCFALGNYELAVREAVLGIKSGALETMISDLAKLLVQEILAGDSVPSFDLIVPIPMPWRRRWGRKTLVAEQLAEKISKLIAIPCIRRALRYKRVTAKQGTLSTTERIKNVKDALQAARPNVLENKSILIVDDVMTSGATLNEAATVCLRAGARSVSVAVVARGVGRSMNRTGNRTGNQSSE